MSFDAMRQRWRKEDKAAYERRLKEHRRKQRRRITVAKLVKSKVVRELRKEMQEYDRKHPERLIRGIELD